MTESTPSRDKYLVIRGVAGAVSALARRQLRPLPDREHDEFADHDDADHRERDGHVAADVERVHREAGREAAQQDAEPSE
jgi:hypothetical protein